MLITGERRLYDPGYSRSAIMLLIVDIGYRQPNDERQNESLNINHNTMLWLNKGELFHAPTEDPRSVLDVGTGTGIWAM